ncbi:MAG: phage holin family protein [Patescibacteria group bacterium]
MKSILRNMVFYSFALFLISQVLAGVKVSGGAWTYILGGIILSLLFLFVKPILNVVTLPLNIITLGAFSFLINVIILYLLTIFVTSITIGAFTFNGFSFAGFVVPKISLNNFFAFIVASILLSLIIGGLKWMTER